MRSILTLGPRPLTSCLVLALALWAQPGHAQVLDVVVGVTATCPYGLEACWAGAYESLMRLDGVESVDKSPNAYNSTAKIRLKGSGLPDPGAWASQFKSMVDKSYLFRGVEVTVEGVGTGDDGGLALRVPGLEHPITLKPLAHKLQWNSRKEASRQPEPDEKDAYQELAPKAKGAGAEGLKLQLTGPLTKSSQGYSIEVREYIAQTRSADPSPQN
jgi:galactose oxidase